MVIREDILKNANISVELNNVLNFMENRLSKELPTTVLDLYYYVLACLTKTDNLMYKFLEDVMTTMAIDTIRESYSKYISSKSLNAVKPDRKIIYDENFYEVFSLAKEISKEYEKNGERVTTLYMLLAILSIDEFSSDKSENKIKKIFIKAGVTYKIINEKIEQILLTAEDTLGNKNKHIEDNTNVRIVNIGNGTIVNDNVSNSDIEESISAGIPIININNSKKQKSKNSYIKSYCTNLNDLVEEGKIDPLIGRGNESNEIIRILGRRKKNNVILVGQSGVGKTAIAENIAYKIQHGDVPKFLLNKTIVSLDMTALMAGTSLRGMFEERVKGILDEVKNDGNFIVFIDNIGSALSDRGKNEYDISSMLSRSLENGYCQVIGTSDLKQYRTTFDKDPSLSRRFQKIIIDVPSKEDCLDIIHGIKDGYEKYHNVKYTEDALKSCVDLAAKYITERNLPDSAIDILDEVGSLIRTSCGNDETNDIIKKINGLKNEISTLRDAGEYVASDEKEKEYRILENELSRISDEEKKHPEKYVKEINVEDILNVVSVKTGIPVSQLNEDDKKRLSLMNERLKKDVIGQDDAIDIVCRAIKRNRIGLRKNGACFSAMFIGKTGLGKTYLAKKLAKEMFGTEQALIRFDMSEYSDKTAVNKLIGSNPGYVGYEDGGLLTESVKNKKYCVLLLDEIEKADPEAYNIFLQVLDEGFLTDNSGMKVDFSNVIVLFTSNIGAKSASDFGRGIGFIDNTNENTKRILTKELKNKFPPEFLNRLDNIIYFNNLSDDNLKDIIKIEINKLKDKLIGLNYDIKYDESVVDYIFNLISEEKEFGARPIARSIRDNIEDKITDLILDNGIQEHYIFNISVNDSKIVVS